MDSPQSQPMAAPVWPAGNDDAAPISRFGQFLIDSDNQQFRQNLFTWISLCILLVAYPGQALLGGDIDVKSLLETAGQGALIFMLTVTVAFQWGIFLVNYLAAAFEGTGLKGIGIGKLRLVHLFWGVAFVLAANLVLSGCAWLFEQIGMPANGELGFLIPESLGGKLLWVVVSFTAGFCEEAAFRGYLMTRLRLLWKAENWLWPTLVSSLVFGLCHVYQGFSNVVLITLFGIMFALLYIRTGSIWPGIIAHFLNNTGALFFPQG